MARVLDNAERGGNADPPVRLMYGLMREEAGQTFAALSCENIADARGIALVAANIVVNTVYNHLVAHSSQIISSQGGLYGTHSQTWGGIGAIEKQIDPTLRYDVVAGETQTNLCFGVTK